MAGGLYGRGVDMGVPGARTQVPAESAGERPERGGAQTGLRRTSPYCILYHLENGLEIWANKLYTRAPVGPRAPYIYI